MFRIEFFLKILFNNFRAEVFRNIPKASRRTRTGLLQYAFLSKAVQNIFASFVTLKYAKVLRKTNNKKPGHF